MSTPGPGQLELLEESLLSGWAPCVKSGLCLGKGGHKAGRRRSIFCPAWLLALVPETLSGCVS